jgi:prolyl-tRNA synthetase
LILKDWIKLVETFEGIIGAVAGVVFTLIITHILKNAGKVTSQISVVTTKFDKHNRTNGIIGPVETLEDADHASINFTVDFFNNSESHKALNNLSINLLDEDKSLLQSIVPYDMDTRRSTNYSVSYDEISHLNIGPKELIKKELTFGFHSGNITILKESSFISFSYHSVEGKINNKSKKTEHLIKY